jgi:uncharacterized membrane protein YqjE
VDSDAQLPEVAAPREGLRHSIARVTAAFVGLLSTRAELASVELAEEWQRLLRRLGLVAAAGLLIAFALMFAGAFVIVLFWDTHRLWAIAIVSAVHLAAGLVLIGKVRAMGRDTFSPFAATIDELKKDRDALQRALADRER